MIAAEYVIFGCSAVVCYILCMSAQKGSLFVARGRAERYEKRGNLCEIGRFSAEKCAI